MPSLTIENYVKTIYQLCSRSADGVATTGQIATALGVSPGTVTSMLKTLSETELASYTPYEGVQLGAPGVALALRVLRRHRLIEQFLATTLELSWDEVHEEAENMEHAVSDLLVDRIEEFLGFPATDPHGDPIPTADGRVAELDCRCLADMAVGDGFRLVRVVDQSPEFLQSLSEQGIHLGVEGQIAGRQQDAGTVDVEVSGIHTSLGLDTAEKLMVAARSL